ncbi:MAG: asparaginase domain-containing protein [Flavobacteriaceae bacterium]|nr:asparaginase domain-containing protein [Flavobacteriaceae bacterium]
MIYILTTGGTIEGFEYDNLNQVPTESPMPLDSLLYHIDNLPEYHIKRVFLKDSRFINDADRALIASEIVKSKYSKVIITHGTLTMVETAKFLGKLRIDKTIVLTGAFILGTDPKTDAFENLSFALTKISDLEQGVYLAMHQSIFPWNNVKKNIQEKRFEKVKK